MLDFDYNIINQNDIRVASFKGKMSKDIKDRLEVCHQELVGMDGKLFILIFKDVPTIEPSIFRELVMLQQDLRKKNRGLFVVGGEFAAETVSFRKSCPEAK